MLDFNKYTDFDKLFIDTKYIFDIIFWVKTEWIKDTIGKLHHLRNVVAVKREEDQETEIYLNITDDENSCNAHQEPMEYFEYGLNIKKQILNFLNEHMEEIKYTYKEKILDIPEIEDNLKYMLDRTINNINSDEVYKQIKNIKIVPFNLEIQEGINFENNIYYTEDKDCYLLESRLFNDGEDGRMLDAYLMIIKSDMTLIDNYIDDVWEYGDWQRIE